MDPQDRRGGKISPLPHWLPHCAHLERRESATAAHGAGGRLAPRVHTQIAEHLCVTHHFYRIRQATLSPPLTKKTRPPSRGYTAATARLALPPDDTSATTLHPPQTVASSTTSVVLPLRTETLTASSLKVPNGAAHVTSGD